MAVLACKFLGCGIPDSTPVGGGQFDPPAEQNSATEVLSFDAQTARLEIKNQTGLPATLYRIEGNDLIEAAKLNAGEIQHSFVVPSGFYVVRVGELENVDSSEAEQSSIAFPAPAIASILDSQPLKVEISQPPKAQPGWCWIPAGPAVVGDTLGVGSPDERPARIESVSAFWLAETEITNQQYANFLSSGPAFDERWIDLDSKKCRVQKLANRKYNSDAPDLPVVMVSFYGAQAYCDWLTEKTNQKHRLPNEVEWEKAARGPNSNIYSYGNIYQQSMANQESGSLKKVKSYQPNGYGLFDMTGNVFEWMANQNDPSSDKIYNQSLRGGSFVLDGMYLRNSFRMRQSKSVMTDDIGFRIAKDPN